MKTVYELSEDELSELKRSYADTESGLSYEELVESDNIPNQEIYDFYGGICFTEDDFFCNQE